MMRYLEGHIIDLIEGTILALVQIQSKTTEYLMLSAGLHTETNT